MPWQQTGGIDGVEKTEFFPPTVQAMKAFVQFKEPLPPQEMRAMVTQIRDLARSHANENLSIYLYNRDLIGAEIDERTRPNLILMGLFVTMVTCFLFWIILKRTEEVIIPLVIMATAAVWTFGLAGVLGFRLSFLHLLVLPILLGTGNDDAFVFGREYVKERAGGVDLIPAIENVFAKTGKATFLTTFTTFIAFGVTAAVTGSEAIRTFDILVASSMLIVFVVTVSLQGPLRIWMARTTEGERRESVLRAKLEGIVLELPRALQRLSLRYTLQRRGRTLLVAGLIGGLGLWLGLGLKADSSVDLLLRPDMQTTQAHDADARFFGLVRKGYILIEGDVESPSLVQDLRQLERNLFRYPLAQKVLRQINANSITELLDKLFIRLSPHTDMRTVFDRIAQSDQTANFVLNQTFRKAARSRLRNRDGRYDGLLVGLVVNTRDGAKTRTFIDQIRHEMDELGFAEYDGVKIRVGGGDMSAAIEEGELFRDFLAGVGLSLVLNGLVLLALWRSVTLGVVALIPVLLSLAVALGTMVVFGVKLNILNLAIGAIVIGVGIDYPIHIVERYLEAKRAGAESSLMAINEALESMGPSVWAGALTTIAGFSACTVLAMPLAVTFGLLMAWVVLLVFRVDVRVAGAAA